MSLLDRFVRRASAAPPPVRRAAVQSLAARPRLALEVNEPWQDQVRRYDDEGPGFVGFALDAKSLVASMARLVVQRRTSSGWGTIDDPWAYAALQAYQGIEEDQPDLIRQQYRNLEAVGEYWMIPLERDGAVKWLVVQSPALEFRGDNLVRVDFRLGASGFNWGDTGSIMVRRDQVYRCWQPHPVYRDLATSPFKRALPDIRRYKSIARNVQRTVDSRLLTNGLMWFPPEEEDDILLPEPDRSNQSAEDVINGYVKSARRALEEDSAFEAFAPYPVTTPKRPEYVEVGRNLDPEVAAAEEQALKAVGRALDFPQQLLVEGPGAGNHWSDYILEDNFLKTAVAPKLGMVCGHVTMIQFRPTLLAMKQRGAPLDDPSQYRIWYDLSEVARKPDAAVQLLRAYELGLAGRRVVNTALGISSEEEMELPPGMSEYDHWLTVKNPAAGVPGGTNTRLQVKKNESKEPDPGRALAMQGAAAPVFDDVSQEEINSLFSELNDIDTQTWDEVDEITRRTAVEAVAAAGRVLRESAVLPDEVEDAAVPFVVPSRLRREKYHEMASAATDVIRKAGPDVRRILARSWKTAQGVMSSRPYLDKEEVMALPMDGAEAAEFWVQDLSRFVNERLLYEPLTAAPGVEFGGYGTLIGTAADVFNSAPGRLTRDVLRVAMGALTHPEGNVVQDLVPGAGYFPKSRYLSNWIAGSGPATSPQVVKMIRARVRDTRVWYRWVHGSPRRPLRRHQRADGIEYTDQMRHVYLQNPSGFPAPIIFPGDHEGCTCREEIMVRYHPSFRLPPGIAELGERTLGTGAGNIGLRGQRVSVRVR